MESPSTYMFERTAYKPAEEELTMAKSELAPIENVAERLNNELWSDNQDDNSGHSIATLKHETNQE